jgi:hypothetical protein
VLVLCQGEISAEFLREDAIDDQLFAAASPSVAGNVALQREAAPGYGA